MSTSGATSSSSPGPEDINKTLFKKAMGGDWGEVINLYNNYPNTHSARMTESGNTVVNIAVLEGQDKVVEKLVALMKRHGVPRAAEALGTEIEGGNTSLHYAATMGNVRMCKCIAEIDPGLIGRRNNDGETPLFLAVLHGEMHAFLCLHSVCSSEPAPAYTYCRRKDGDTILHCAISGEYLVCGKHNPKQNQDAEDPNRQEHRNKIKEVHGSMAAHKNRHHPFPANYITCFEAIKFLSKAIVMAIQVIFRLGSLAKIVEKKQKHVWSNQVMYELLERTSSYEDKVKGRHPPQKSVFGTTPYSFEDGGYVTFSSSVFTTPPQLDANGERSRMWELSKETTILIAARNGVVEMVDNILQRFPEAIHDTNADKKNTVLLAVESRQQDVYQLLLKKSIMKGTIFRQADKDGNSALHLAAKLGDYHSWLNQDAALHMQREIKWYQLVKMTMPVGSVARLNNDGDTPNDLFVKTHRDVVKAAAEWLTHTAESCSFVAALVATVAFTTSTTIPGGLKQDIGTPAFKDEPLFYVFAISSLVALCVSVTSTVTFLGILTSGFQIREFHTSLPRKLLMGLATLCVSIFAMMISFCASHFFILKDKLNNRAVGLYVGMALLPVIMTFILMSKFPHSSHLMWATFTKRPRVIPPPERSDEMILP